MWIRSQSLLTLANFECLKIRQYGSKEFGIVGDGDIILGKYSTKEKAMEVLNDIYFRIKYADIDEVLVYEMPKDEDVEV